MERMRVGNGGLDSVFRSPQAASGTEPSLNRKYWTSPESEGQGEMEPASATWEVVRSLAEGGGEEERGRAAMTQGGLDSSEASSMRR